MFLMLSIMMPFHIRCPIENLVTIWTLHLFSAMDLISMTSPMSPTGEQQTTNMTFMMVFFTTLNTLCKITFGLHL